MKDKNTLYRRALSSLEKAGFDGSVLREEWFSDRPYLLICGGGHVAQAIADYAGGLDFYVKVIDERPGLAVKDRFPMAEEVICDSYDHLDRYMEPDGFCIVATHDHQADFQCVRALMKQPFRYLGMLGSRRKVATLHQLLEADIREGRVNREVVDRLYAPVGLSIGAETPAEIAISILAQIIQVKNQKANASCSKELLESDMSGMLCVIIEKTGSGPRGTGAMMLVGKDKTIGTVGGGIVEASVIQSAREALGPCLADENAGRAAEKAPVGGNPVFVRAYNMTGSESEMAGMICGGSNRILFIRV